MGVLIRNLYRLLNLISHKIITATQVTGQTLNKTTYTPHITSTALILDDNNDACDTLICSMISISPFTMVFVWFSKVLIPWYMSNNVGYCGTMSKIFYSVHFICKNILLIIKMLKWLIECI